jgi:hypothetical protein
MSYRLPKDWTLQKTVGVSKRYLFTQKRFDIMMQMRFHILIIRLFILPLMINAYGKGNQKKFLIEGSEMPQSIPSWVWILIIGIAGWVFYYLISYLRLTQ